MNETIKNPSLIPEWFITSGGKVTGIHDADGKEYQFVGASEKGADGKDGKTPALKINEQDGFKWQVNYDNGQGWKDVPGSPAASGMVGPQGETGPSGNSIVLQSAIPADGGVKVTLAWGENETSAFVIPSGAPGSSYAFDQTTTSGDGSAEDPIGVNTNVIATKDDLDDYVKRDALLPENGISGDYVSQDNKYHFGLATSGIDANKQYAWTTNGWQEVTAQGSIAAGTDLVLESGVMKVNTNGVANSAGKAFVEGADTVASGAASHAEGKFTSAFSPYSHVEGYNNVDSQIHSELIGANHTEGAYNQTSGVYAHVEGHANKLYGYGVHMQGGYNEFTIHNTSADRNNPNGRWNIWGQSIEGMANKTTSEPISGYDGNTPLYYHGGILKVIGNGTRTVTDPSKPEETQVIDRSDALILYRDGSMWVQGPISANGVELGNANDKVDLPDSSLANMWLIYSTLSGEKQPHGWADATEVFYTKSSSDGRYIKKGSEGLSLNIGSNNTVQNDGKCAAIGNRCNVSGNSFVVCDDNSACDNSFAFGWKVKAKLYSLAGGHGDPASQYASTIAENYSMALGDACEAYNYSQAFGRGVKFTGNANGKGALAIGGWNKTQSDALFVIGNGTGNGNRSDALAVDYNGNTTVNGSVSSRVADGKNILAVASAATLIGASRQTAANYGVNDTALGTTWLGVGGDGMHQGFIKYSDGGNVGALDTASMIQLNFKPSTNNYDSVTVLQNGNSVGNLIPAQIHQGSYTPTSADGILHIVVES